LRIPESSLRCKRGGPFGVGAPCNLL
jgi:hypothetical protein